jgi:hypothetical protein
MKKLLNAIVGFLLITNMVNAQNKMGNIWVVGGRLALTAEFNGIARPTIQIKYDSLGAGFPYYFGSSGSNISDSASGKLLFMSNAMKIWDSTGAVMQNGDSMQPLNAYTHNNPALLGQTQGSLILPKGTNGQYYVFVPTVSDTTYNTYWTGASGLPKAPFDILYVNVVDMQANGGLGSVIVKNKKLLHDTELIKVGMQACKHANGRDWWLVKQGGYGKNELIKYLVTKDSIYGPYTQTFPEPALEYFDLNGQIAFSPDGKKFASAISKNRQFFLADFDRCSGEFSNPKVKYVPLDSTTIPNPLPQYIIDSGMNGVCFSPNGNYLYISRRYNIYQYEYGLSDSSLAWVRVQHGPDTTYNKFQYYGHLYRGPDGRIYIGNEGGTAKQFSVLDYPNSKGLACGFCRKCFRLDTSAYFGITSPPNMPDYTLGADMSKVCWPLSTQQYEVGSEQVVVWPNPSNYKIKVESIKYKDAIKYLYNSIGQLMLSTKENEIDVSHLANGVYYLKCGIYTRKVVVE